MPRAELAGERREVMRDRVQLERIYMGFVIPPFGDDDWYAGDLLSTALTAGKSSLLYEDLVYRRQLAQDVSCYPLPTEEASTLLLTATAKPGVEAAVLLAARNHQDGPCKRGSSHGCRAARNQRFCHGFGGRQPAACDRPAHESR
ncbi:MAG: insulinase family protein [Thermoanaerobaculia bacterium]|nr:insulinase family protein [Thermoanaerobaculia bacterium]